MIKKDNFVIEVVLCTENGDIGDMCQLKIGTEKPDYMYLALYVLVTCIDIINIFSFILVSEINIRPGRLMSILLQILAHMAFVIT